jgi:ornithine cyclodeaminase
LPSNPYANITCDMLVGASVAQERPSGSVEVLIVDAATVRASCSMLEAIEAVEEGFRALTAGIARVPIRTQLALGEDKSTLLLMPARLDDHSFVSVKLASVVESNKARGLPMVHAMLVLTDRRTGVPVAILEGAALTALRTGAAGGLAARRLARPDASVVALYGAGVQARAQLEAVLAVRPVREVRVVSQSPENAAKFIGSLQIPGVRFISGNRDAAKGADIIVCATSSSTPVFDTADLARGVHVTGIGAFRPDMVEIPPEAFKGARVVVDERGAARREAGDLIAAINLGYVLPANIIEIGEADATRHPEDDRTLFKSVGNAVQDLAVAARAYKHAKAHGLGVTVRL